MKANQITAIGVSIIALGVIIAGGIYFNKEREQTIIKKEQETRNIYSTCMTDDVTLTGRLYQLQRQNGNWSGALETLERCLKKYGITELDENYLKLFNF